MVLKRVIIFLLLVFPTAWKTSAQKKLNITGPVKMLALGDSYTYGQSVPRQDTWPAQLSAALSLRAVQVSAVKVIAVSGWTTTDLINAIGSDKPSSDYTLVSLLIGVNNYYRGGSTVAYNSEFESLLKEAIRFANGQPSHVVVLSIPDYGYTPFGMSQQPTISAGINYFNTINERIASNYGVPYINITDISREGLSRPDLVATDGLHPSGKQYGLWVDLILSSATITKSDNPVEPPDEDITSVTETGAAHVVYPNPFHDELKVRGLNKIGLSSFTMTDAMGRVVLHKIIGSSDQILSVSDLVPGVYHYRIIDNQQHSVISGKLVKGGL